MRNPWPPGRISLACCLLLFLLHCGCVSDSYQYGIQRAGQPFSVSAARPPEVSFGGAHPHLDRLERMVQAPRRMIGKWVGRPPMNPETRLQQREQAIQLASNYLVANGLEDVRLEVREYDPSEQWQRLKDNREIRPIWKYTGGTANWLRYTLLPARVFQSDRYDPFTNTLHLNSDDLANTIYETAQAKEFRRSRLIDRGSYAMLQYVPFVPVVHHSRVASDALTFSQHHLDGSLTSELYPLSYSRIGSTVISETLSVVSLSPNAPIYSGPVLRGAGGIVGRSVGVQVARQPVANASANDPR